MAIIGALLGAVGASFGADAPAPVNDQIACESAPARSSSLAKITLMAEMHRLAELGVMPMACFVSDPTPEQLAEIISKYGALPMQAYGIPQPRFWTATNQWKQNVPTIGTGTEANSQCRSTNLTYSFIPDGTGWFHCNSGGSFPSTLTANLSTAFTINQEDKGRELIRQGLAGWRRFVGLNYTAEMADDGAAWSSTSLASAARGIIRIGGVAEGTNGILACNNFPTSGGDMSINSSYFIGSAFTNSANNYRYLRNVLAHEHGHGVGYGHPVPCDNTKLMEPFINTNFDLLQLDDRRGGMRNYGDRFAGNNSVATAKDFGDLNAASKSVIEPHLSTNGTAGNNNSDEDWFRFTLATPSDITITVTPTGNDYQAGTQSSSCSANESPIPVDHALIAGNLNVTLYASDGTTVVNAAPFMAAGVAETIDRTTAGPNGILPAGTYYVKVQDVGPNTASDQFVQTYDLLVRNGTTKAPPKAIAGLNKRCLADVNCYFYSNINSYVTEPGSSIVAYSWDFDGDGNFDSPIINPAFVYVSNGVYNATLRVTTDLANGGSMTNTDTITVTIYNVTSLASGVSPMSSDRGFVVPVTINGKNFKGVTASSQVTVSGTGVTVLGTPSVNHLGTQITGLSFDVGLGIALGARDVTITNCDGTGPGLGHTAVGNGVFTVTGPIEIACCQNDGSCTALVIADCNTAGGFNGGSTCTPNPCALACCFDDGSCQALSVNDCATALGDVQAPGSVCSPNPCPQPIACCQNDGSCAPLFLADCTTAGGFNGGSTCTPNPCALACCFDDGSCLTLSVNDCNTALGDVQPAGSVCVPNPCTQPVVACCHPDGSCTESLASACTGVAQPYPSTCTPNDCPPAQSACCYTSGACLMKTEADCLADSGISQAFPAVCVPNPCPQPPGLCCYGATCSVNVPIEECNEQFLDANNFERAGSLFVPGTDCNLVGPPADAGPKNFKVPCCKSDYNKSGAKTVQDLFDYLADYFKKYIGADVNGAPPEPGTGVTVGDLFDYLAAYFAGGCP